MIKKIVLEIDLYSAEFSEFFHFPFHFPSPFFPRKTRNSATFECHFPFREFSAERGKRKTEFRGKRNRLPISAVDAVFNFYCIFQANNSNIK